MHRESGLWNKRDSAGHAFADFGKQSKCDAATETDTGNPSREGRGRSDRKEPIGRELNWVALHVDDEKLATRTFNDEVRTSLAYTAEYQVRESQPGNDVLSCRLPLARGSAHDCGLEGMNLLAKESLEFLSNCVRPLEGEQPVGLSFHVASLTAR